MELLIERCDRCQAQAYVKVIKNSFQLFFCGHHTNKYYDFLDATGWSIEMDTRDLLTRQAVGAEVR